MITFAKGVTSGYIPLGGVVASEEIAAPYWAQPGGPTFRHGATYAGHPTACAAALAVIDIYEREELIPRGRALELPLYDALAQFSGHPAVAEVRGGCGFLAAVGLVPDANVTQLADGARDAGVLVRPLLGGIAVSPPLICDQSHLDLLAEGIAAGLERV
jgi:adenosylmethionine-8-amino-7-oxononanoate aminotransferase